MSIHAISGKPGGGKSMYSVKLIMQELLYGSRVIITNVGLRPGAINEWIQREHPSKNIDLFKRLILIDEEQMGQFFTVRPPGSIGPKLLTKEEWSNGKIPDYTGVNDSGVMYVLDEIHIKFNARAWMNTGQDVLYYLSQHRKLGDTVIWITQAINNVDKQFRSVTQDYTFIRNLGKERMSHFHLPSIFVRQTYTSPPTDNATPMESGSFKMDVKGLASLYDTAKGVGIHGMAGADMAEKKKGLPIWVFVVGIVSIIGLGLYFIPKIIAKMFTPAKAQTWSALPTKTNIVHKVETKNETKTESSTVTNVATWQQSSNRLFATGFDRLAGKYRVYLSDGTVVEEGDPSLAKIDLRRGVIYGGQLVPWKRYVQENEYVAPTPPVYSFEGQPERQIQYKVVKR